MKNIHLEKLTQSVIDSMKKLGSNWAKSWNYKGTIKNLVSKTSYRGFNVLCLSLSMLENGYKYPYFLTFKQAQSKGYKIKKGSKGTHIIFFKMQEIEETKNNEQVLKKIPLLRSYVVFNVDQLDDFDYSTLETNCINENERIANCDTYIKNTHAKVNEIEGDRAYYSPIKDEIVVPTLNQFNDSVSFYGTVLHELVHWSGNKKRLDRLTSAPFGSDEYAKEELIAELGAIFLCNQLGIETTPRDDHSQYLNSWISALNDDVRLIYKASSKAQKALDYLNDLQEQKAQSIAS